MKANKVNTFFDIIFFLCGLVTRILFTILDQNSFFPSPACRYEKGAWSECTNGQTSRTDKLKTTSDPSCQATREVNKNCNPSKGKGEKKERKNGKPDKGSYVRVQWTKLMH